MYKEFKDEGATVRVFGNINHDSIKKSTELFMKGVEERKEKKRNGH